MSSTLASGSVGTDAACLADDCYTITCGGGSYASEVSWILTDDATGSVLASGGSPYTGATLCLPAVFGCTDPGACNYDSLANIDDNSCQFICDPYIASASVVAAPSCNGGTDASATAFIDGSFGDDYWLWSDGQVSSTAVGLAAGTYTCTISDLAYNITATDSLGNPTDSVQYLCSSTVSVTIDPTLAISISGAKIDATPGDTNGSVNITVAGGNDTCLGGYTYLWSNGDTTQNVAALPVGPISLTVTDCNGCTATGSWFILTNWTYGCTDPLASNYDAAANANWDQDTTGATPACLYDGCTDSLALNYDATANNEDGSCTYSCEYFGTNTMVVAFATGYYGSYSAFQVIDAVTGDTLMASPTYSSGSATYVYDTCATSGCYWVHVQNDYYSSSAIAIDLILFTSSF
jgi:hypothetical protein